MINNEIESKETINDKTATTTKKNEEDETTTTTKYSAFTKDAKGCCERMQLGTI